MPYDVNCWPKKKSDVGFGVTKQTLHDHYNFQVNLRVSENKILLKKLMLTAFHIFRIRWVTMLYREMENIKKSPNANT